MIDIGSQSLLWGVGLFETMLVLHGRVIHEALHFERMCEAARALELPAPDATEWKEAVREAPPIDSSSEEHALRCTWLDTCAHDDSESGWNVIATRFPIPATTLRRRKEGRVILLPPTIRRTIPQHKSLSHLASVIGLRMAREAGSDEAIFTTDAGQVLEGTSTNVFAIDHDVVSTPPVEAGILPGVVREWVLRNAHAAGLTVTTRALDRDDLLAGSFMTSSLTLLAPVRSVDGVPAREPGVRFNELSRLFREEIGLTAHTPW